MATAAGFTHKINRSYTGDGKTVASVVGTYTGDANESSDLIIPAGTVNKEIDIAFPHDTIQSLAFMADQAMTVLTNSTGSPGNTVQVPAAVGTMWGNDFPNASPITVDVTKLYVSNPGSVDGHFQFAVLFNSKP